MNWNQLPGCIAMLVGLGLAAPLACVGEDPPGGQLLQDFSAPPAYSFLSWEGKPKAVDGALIVQVPERTYVQSVVLSGTLLSVGVLLFVLGFVTELISINRRLQEEVLARVREVDVRVGQLSRRLEKERRDG